MTTEIKKVWFVDGQIIEQEIPEADIYKRSWDVAACKAYAEQLRNKDRANTAEHAAEAIEYLLAELAAEQQFTQRQTARIVDLQTHIENLEGEE